MFSPVSPEFVYVIHKDKERELEYKIEQARIARERRSAEAGSSLEQKRSLLTQVSQWMKGKLFSREAASSASRS